MPASADNRGGTTLKRLLQGAVSALLYVKRAARTAPAGLAAPAGGATFTGWRRGCALTFLLAFGTCGSAAASDEPQKNLSGDTLDLAELSVPSGHDVAFQDMVWDERGFAGLTYRFRFVSPSIVDRSFEDVSADMEHLCNVYALPRVSVVGPRPKQIIVSLASEETAFGEAQPDILQYFEAYSVEEGRCVWELF